ncbi:MAG: extracellular solute-binding protein [Chloroflexota bacterium]
MDDLMNPTAWTGSRRAMLQQAGAGALGLALVACAPTAAPASAPPAAAPAAPAAARPEWSDRWDKTVAAARQEGALTLLITGSAGYAGSIDAFRKAYPGIEVDAQGPSAMGTIAQKLIGERKAGLYTWDVAQIYTVTAFSTFKAEGFWAPIRPTLIRPEVTEDANWYGGFEYGFLDADRKIAYGFSWEKQITLFYNSDLVAPGEVRTLQDLLSPKWKGKIVFLEPWTSGSSFTAATAMRLKAGNGVLKQLFVDQEVAISRDARLVTEDLVRGKYAIGTADVARLSELQGQGVGANVKLLDIPEITMIRENSVFLFDKAPHPNAAAVFINWLLSKDGQVAWSRDGRANSRRRDVPPLSRDLALSDGDEKKFVRANVEDTLPRMVESQELLKQLLVR